jgi:hypothetical protein
MSSHSPQPRRRLWIVVVGVLGLLVIVGLVVGLPLLQTAMKSYSIQLGAFPTATPFEGSVTEAEIAEIGDLLRAAGLPEGDYLLSTGVAEHLERLRAGAVSPDAVRRYAANLVKLTELAAAYGDPIPVTFWDVQSTDMRTHGLREYAIADAIVQPDSEPYLSLLARAYNRLVAFHQAGEEQDTALDAEFDIFQMVVDYYEKVAGESPDDAKGRAEYGKALVLIWQQVMFSTSRTNPLTGASVISHSIFNRFNITSMWRYRMGENIWLGEIWGVSGFAHRYVGDPGNDNQVEHATISAVLQVVLGNPVKALNAIEYKELLTGKANQAHTDADIAVNNAIATAFVPRFTADYRGTIEHLRCVLAEREGC